MEYETWAESLSSGGWRLRLTPQFVEVAGGFSFVELLLVGTRVSVGGPVGLAVTTDFSESELTSPVSGRIAAVNKQVHLQEPPDLLNSDPQGSGWLVELESMDLESSAKT